jgi:hypothetical protein
MSHPNAKFCAMLKTEKVVGAVLAVGRLTHCYHSRSVCPPAIPQQRPSSCLPLTPYLSAAPLQ